MSDALSPADEIEKKRLFRAYSKATKGGEHHTADRLKKLISIKKRRPLTQGEADQLNDLKVVSQGDALDLIWKKIIPFAQKTKDVETIDFVAKCVFDAELIKRFDWTIRNSIRVLIELVIQSKVRSKKFNALILKSADEHGLTYPIFMHVLKDYCIYLRRSSEKFLAGEKMLVKSFNHMGLVNYADDVIKGVWPEAESRIIEDPFAAARYAYSCIGSRWLEAEYIIFQERHAADPYLKFIGITKQEAIETNDELKRRLDKDYEIIESQDNSDGLLSEAKKVKVYSYPDPTGLTAEECCKIIGDRHPTEKVRLSKYRWHDAEPIIMKDPEWALQYTIYVINNGQNLGIRWPEAEPYIAKDHRWASRYAIEVINRSERLGIRWPLAEPVIKTNPENAYWYACVVVDSDRNGIRWLEAEPYIMTDPHCAFKYAIYVINSAVKPGKKLIEWPEAEPYIMQNPYYAANYACVILGDRWPEAEYHILQDDEACKSYLSFLDITKQEVIDSNDELRRRLDSDNDILESKDQNGIVMTEWRRRKVPKDWGASQCYEYARDVIGDRWFEAESVIINEPQYAYEYARDVIGDRWPEAEDNIAKDHSPHSAAVDYARDLIGGRWLQAEPYLIRDGVDAADYAKKVIEGRWPEAEYNIITHPWPGVKARYLEFLRMTEPEIISTNTRLQKHFDGIEYPDPHTMDIIDCVKYASNYIKGRWTEAEEAIITFLSVELLGNEHYRSGRTLETATTYKRSEWEGGRFSDHSGSAIGTLIKYCVEVIRPYDKDNPNYDNGRWPEAERIVFMGKAHPRDVFSYVKEVVERRCPEVEDLLVDNPKVSIKYVYDILNNGKKGAIRWPEAEWYMFDPQETIYPYNDSKFDHRFEKQAYCDIVGLTSGEIIDTNPVLKGKKDSLEYFKRKKDSTENDILENQDDPHRVLLEDDELEPDDRPDPSLMTSGAICEYVEEVINGGQPNGIRWPEAEPYILQNPNNAYWYTVCIINKSEDLGIRWPEAESVILGSGDSTLAYVYARNIMHSDGMPLRWPEAEYLIFTNGHNKRYYLIMIGMTEQEAIDTNPQLKRRLETDNDILESQENDNDMIFEDRGEETPDPSSMEPKELYYNVVRAIKANDLLDIDWDQFVEVYPDSSAQWLYFYILQAIDKGKKTGDRWYDAEPFIKYDAKLACYYTIDIINKGQRLGIRWPEAEPYIMKNSGTAFYYTVHVINGGPARLGQRMIRWPEAEYYILTNDGDGDHSYKNGYLTSFGMTGQNMIDTNPELKRRLDSENEIVEGQDNNDNDILESIDLGGGFEPIDEQFHQPDPKSMTPAMCAGHAENVLFRRWKEAEPRILLAKPLILYCYAKGVIWPYDTENPEYDNGRWPEAEEEISSDPEAAYMYAKNILLQRWPEAEEKISENPHFAYLYASNVIKPYDKNNPEYDNGRWPKIERMILNGRIGNLERYISKVIGGRWEEAEYRLFQDEEAKDWYLSYILKMTEKECIDTNPLLLKKLEADMEILESQGVEADRILFEFVGDDGEQKGDPPDPSALSLSEIYRYIYNTLNKGSFPSLGLRWPEAEPFIMKHAGYVCAYTISIINRNGETYPPIRWLEAEYSIIQNLEADVDVEIGDYDLSEVDWKIKYLKFFGITQQQMIDTNPQLKRRLETDDEILESRDSDAYFLTEAKPSRLPDPSKMTPLECYKYTYQAINKGLNTQIQWPEAEPYIMVDPISAFLYTRDIINNPEDPKGIRWPDAEPYIMVEPGIAFAYVNEVMNPDYYNPQGIRWPEAEPYIMKDPKHAYSYAVIIINRDENGGIRWPEGEYAIFQNEDFIIKRYLDAIGMTKQEVINTNSDLRRRLESDYDVVESRNSQNHSGELILEVQEYPKKPDPATMSLDEMVSYFAYGINHRIAVGVRWLEAEPYIMQDPKMAVWYAYNVINMREKLGIRWHEAEPCIATDPVSAFEYAWQIINIRTKLGKRWPIAEYAIFQNDDRTIKRYLDFANTTADEVYKTNHRFKRRIDSDNDIVEDDNFNGEVIEEAYNKSYDPESLEPEACFQVAMDADERWAEAEWKIMTDPWVSWLYAKYVVKGRWFEAESLILNDRSAKEFYLGWLGKTEQEVIDTNPEMRRRKKTENDIVESKQGDGLPDYNKMSSFECYSYAKNTIEGRWKAAENKILANRYWAYAYACDVMHEGWPLAEPIIMEEPDLAASYAENALKGRWPEAEYSIFLEEDSKRPYLNFLGMTESEATRTNPLLKRILEDDKQLLENRYESGDERLAQFNLPDPATLEPKQCVFRADWLQGRWKDAEWRIIEDPMSAVRYARFIIKKFDRDAPDYDNGRWPEAEESIMSDPEAIFKYADEVIQGRWEEAEPSIMRSPRYAWLYVMKVMGKRWPEAEYYIFQKEDTKRYYLRMFHMTEQEAIKTNPGLRRRIEQDNEILESKDAENLMFGTRDPEFLSPYECFQLSVQNAGRWKEAEWKIITDPWCSFLYSKHVVKGRWPEAEYIMLSDVDSAPCYLKFLGTKIQELVATNPELRRLVDRDNEIIESHDSSDVLTEAIWRTTDPSKMTLHEIYVYALDHGCRRWPEAEPYIMKDAGWAYTYAKNIINSEDFGQRWPEAEPYIMKDPEAAYLYTEQIINNDLYKGIRWDKAEPFIAKSPKWAAQYCHWIINKGKYLGKRWPEAEPNIIKDPEAACFYADQIIMGRWPKAEYIIFQNAFAKKDYLQLIGMDEYEATETNPELKRRLDSDNEILENEYLDDDLIKESIDYEESYIFDDDGNPDIKMMDEYTCLNYAIKKLKKRWPEAEYKIKKRLTCAYYYALHIIKGRWDDGGEAEDLINESSWWSYMYAKNVIKPFDKDNPEYDNGRWPEAEGKIAIDPESACAYASEILFGRWPEAEYYIFQNSDYASWYLHYIGLTEKEALDSNPIAKRRLDGDYEILESRENRNDAPILEADSIWMAKPDPSKMTPQEIYNHTIVVRSAKRWPEAEPFIKVSPYWAYEYAINVINRDERGIRWPEAEPYIKKEPEIAYWYAISIINMDRTASKRIRWPEAEPYIAQSSEWATNYAIKIINNDSYRGIRWPEAEPFIMKDPINAHHYAIVVIQDRWPEAEYYIFQDDSAKQDYLEHIDATIDDVLNTNPELKRRLDRDYEILEYQGESGQDVLNEADDKIRPDPSTMTPKECYEYTREVINKNNRTWPENRWFEAEPIIMKDPESAYLYTHTIINKYQDLGIRWRAAEPYIATDSRSAYNYVMFVINQGEKYGRRWPEGEPAIMQNPRLAWSYATNVINRGGKQGKRWPEAEPFIMKDPESAYHYVTDVINRHGARHRTAKRWPEAEYYMFNDKYILGRYLSFLGITEQEMLDTNPELEHVKEAERRRKEAENEILEDVDHDVEEILLEAEEAPPDPSTMTAEECYLYTCNVINVGRRAMRARRKRWPEAEWKILEDPWASTMYAIDVIKGRWEEAEYIIASNGQYLPWYVNFLGISKQELIDTNPMLKRRLDADNEIIEYQDFEGDLLLEDDDNHPDPSTMTPEECYYYAKDVLKGRFYDAESNLAKDPEWSFYYTEKIINKGKKLGIRWPEAEPNILEDSKWATFYAEHIIQDRWPEAEPIILSHPYYRLMYAVMVIKGRWPIAEPLISSDAEYAMIYVRYVINRDEDDSKFPFQWQLFNLDGAIRAEGTWKRCKEVECGIYRSDRPLWEGWLWEVYKKYVGYTDQELMDSNPELKRMIDSDNEIVESLDLDSDLILEARNSDPETMTPQECYEYAYDIINKGKRLGIRWRQGEHVIKKDPEMAYLYTSVLINRTEEGSGIRWRAAEPIIMQDPFFAYCYAGDVINRRQFLGIRWPEAESIIATDANAAEKYARYVINKDLILGIRWPEAEPAIMVDADRAYRYARYSIGGRWPEAEYYILDYNQYGRAYLEFLEMTEQELIDTNSGLKRRLESDDEILESQGS